MIKSHADRLDLLTRKFSKSEEFIELLELYGILAVENELFDALTGINSLKFYVLGYLTREKFDMEVKNEYTR